MRLDRRLAAALLCLLIFILIAYVCLTISRSRSFQFFGGIVDQVETTEKVVALTFDDGPTGKTDEILKILEELDVKATFFVTGRELNDNMDGGREIVAAGHELGNHSYSHKRMVLKAPSFIRREIDQTDRLIRDTGYTGDIHFRPPNGKKLLLLPYILKQYDKKTIMWNLEPDSYPDIAASSQNIVGHVVENITPGSIILLHVMYESRHESLNSVTGIVTELRAAGYEFKTVSELLEYEENVVLVQWDQTLSHVGWDLSCLSGSANFYFHNFYVGEVVAAAAEETLFYR